MNVVGLLSPELLDIAKAIGIVNAGGDIDDSWFQAPIAKLGGILSNADQRAAVFDLLDLAVPPATIAGIPSGVKWHPILGAPRGGNVYVTVDEVATPTVVGVGGTVGNASGAPISANVVIALPLVAFDGSGVTLVAGTLAHPVTATLRVALGWSRPAHAIGLNAVKIALRFAPAAAGGPVADATVTLEGLDLDATGARDMVVDPNTLGADAGHLIVALILEQLHQLVGPTGSAASVVTHLPALLGLADNIPVFPLRGGSIAAWLGSILADDAVAQRWLGHLAGLFGATGPVSGGGTRATPWTVPLLAIDATSTLDVTLARDVAADGTTPVALFGAALGIVPSGAAPAARLEIAATIAAVPLRGTAGPQLFPVASAAVRAPGGAAPLIAPGGAIAIGAFRGGAQWDGMHVRPVFELLAVQFEGKSYDRLDLTNTDAVIAAAASGVAAALTTALGGGAGAHLAALAGIIAPVNDPSAPLVDPIALGTGPTGAIAAVHRRALLSTTHSWSHLYEELVALLGLALPIAGTGTPDDPWTASIASAGPARVEIAGWNAQTSGNAADPQRLRIGFRLAAAGGPVVVAWATELLGIDLPQSGAASVALVGGHRGSVALTPGAPASAAGIAVSADRLRFTLDAQTGSKPNARIAIDNLKVTGAGPPVTIASLGFPFAVPLDLANPGPSLGISAADLQRLVLALLAKLAVDAEGVVGLAISALLGLGVAVPGLSPDFPVLGATGPSPFTDPLGALRAWLAAVATGVGAGGSAFAPMAVSWLAALAGNLPPDTLTVPDDPIGSGTYDDPWQIPIAPNGDAIAGLTWLEPAGPPFDAARAAAAISVATTWDALIATVSGLRRVLPELGPGTDPAALSAGFAALADHLATTDGVVPLTSQIPTGAGWSTGAALTSAHSLQPSDPSAIAQILAQSDAWAAGGNRAVLLLGPAVSDRAIWSDLLTKAAAAHPGTTDPTAAFDLRVAAAPSSIDLRTVSAVADWYTADLQDDGSGNIAAQQMQIGLIVARLGTLRAGVKVTLVAHSTAGVAARAYAAANPAQIAGLITIGTPHAGAPLVPLHDATTADAVRTLVHLLPAGVAAGSAHDALGHLVAALDGALPAGTPAGLPIRWPYPVGDFQGAPTTDTGGVPALALGGALGVDLLALAKTALAAAIVAPAAATHLGFGIRTMLDTGGAGAVSVETTVRLDVGRVPLEAAPPEPPRPAHALSARTRWWRDGAWLAGDPGPGTVRVRWAELGAVVTAGPTPVQPFAVLHEAGVLAPLAQTIALGDPPFAAALGGMLDALTATSMPPPATALGGMLATLAQLGIVTPNVRHGGLGISADAVRALAADARAFLAPRVAAALASVGGLAGLSSTSGRPIGATGLEVDVGASPASFTIRTATNASLTVGPLRLRFSAAVALDTLAPTLSFALSGGAWSIGSDGTTLTVAAPPYLGPLVLVPAPSAGVLAAALAPAVERLLASVAISSLIQSLASAATRVRDATAFLLDPGGWLVGTDALGDGTTFVAAKVNGLLATIGTALGAPPGSGLTLPGGLTVQAAGASPLVLALATTAPIGGALDLALSLSIDATRHLTPGGTARITVPVGGTWSNVVLAFGVTSGGISLVVTPGTAAPITLLPQFSGLGALAGVAQALLPAALDALVNALGPTVVGRPPLLQHALDLAAAFDLYDEAGKFTAHGAQLKGFGAPGALGTFALTARNAAINALVALFNDPASALHGVLAGTVTASGTAATWTFTLGGGLGAGTVSATAGWDSAGPTIAISAAGLQPANGAAIADVSAGYAVGALAVSAGIAVDLASSIGIAARPQLAIAAGASGSSVRLLPLGAAKASTLAITLTPSFGVVASADAPLQLIETWVLPLVTDLLLSATGAELSNKMWTGGPTIHDVLSKAGIITGSVAVVPLPDAGTVLTGALTSLTSGTPIALAGGFKLAFVNEAARYGIRFTGAIDVPLDALTMQLLFGGTDDWIGPDAGVTVWLLNSSGPPALAPGLKIVALGLGLAGSGDSPLVKGSGFRLGGADGFLFCDIDLRSGVALTNLGGGVKLSKLGLPLGQLSGASSSNPVAASLFDSNPGNGDAHPVNPGVDIIVAEHDGTLTIRFGGTPSIVIPIHQAFGPIYITQIELDLVDGNTSDPAVELGVSGSVSLAGFTVDVDDLALKIGLREATTPSAWGLDLRGLAVDFEQDPLAISGGLRKNTSAPAVEYDGILSVSFAGRGFSIAAGYSRPSDGQGAYTSLFMFVSLPLPLGGPPFAFIIGVGGGFGFNRELNIPQDLNTLDSFLLVEAINGSPDGNDPMAALLSMAANIPARRGAYWIAAGLKITSFALVNTTAVLYIALDKGFAIGILGLSRMALPTEDLAIVSVELALAIRFSSADGVLSIQAQLTDNSYLFNRDCQLTGGFAFYIKFPTGDFVISIGGYHPAFVKPPEFPDVPRVGFHWDLGFVGIKGESYFALTNSAVMAGCRLEAHAEIGPIKAWFLAYVDFLVSWDPFYYIFDIGVEIGISVNIEVCFFGCVTIGITLSKGAQLHIEGPPFHGTVTVDAYVTTITIPFGDSSSQPPALDWPTFEGKYLALAGDPDPAWVRVHVQRGLLPMDPPGAQPLPGTQAQPWTMATEFAFVTETRMPSSTYMDFLPGDANPIAVSVNAIDLAPMYLAGVTSTHGVVLEALTAGAWVAANADAAHFTIAATNGFFPEATWHYVDPHAMQASARTITAISGLAIDGHAVLEGQSALVEINKLVADDPNFARPLPFATQSLGFGQLQMYGASADVLAAVAANAASARMLDGASQLLSGNGTFSAARVSAGLPANGFDGLAVAALRSSRSSPPLIAPISTGLTMKPVGLGPPVPIERIVPPAPVMLVAPRLLAMLQTRPVAASDAPPAMHTSVANVATASVVRTAPPVARLVAGSRLIIAAAQAAAPSTAAAVATRALRTAEVGALGGQAQRAAFVQAANDIAAGGVTLGPGALHVWELPDDGATVALAGNAAARIVAFDRTNAVLRDDEYAPGSAGSLPLPAGTATIAVASLGRADDLGTVAAGFGAISAAFGGGAGTAVVGWQSASTVTQVGPRTFVARGASIVLARPTPAKRRGQMSSYGTIRASAAIVDQLAIETLLPTAVDVVLVVLDRIATGSEDDLAIAADGAVLGAPIRVTGGAHRMLLYDVAQHTAGASEIAITVGSTGGWQLAGVVGLHGRAVEWATSMQNGVPEHLVPDGPLRPDGTLTLRLQPGAHA